MISIQALHKLIQVLAIHFDTENSCHCFDLHQVERTVLILIEAIKLILNDTIARSQSLRESLDQLAQVSKEIRVLVVFCNSPALLKNMDELITC